MKFMVAWFRALLAGLVLVASMTGLALSAELRMAVTTSFHNLKTQSSLSLVADRKHHEIFGMFYDLSQQL